VKVEKSILIYKPVFQVFEYVTDVTNAPKWSGLIESVIYNTGGPVEVGSRGINIMKLLWKRAEVGWVITNLVVNKSFAVKSTTGPVNGLYYYRFEGVGAQTKLKLLVEVEPKGLYKTLNPLFSPTVAPQITKDLGSLKAILETFKNETLEQRL